MKKLIKKAFGKTLYHVTDFVGFLGILKEGVIDSFAPANAGISETKSEGEHRLSEDSERYKYKDRLFNEDEYAYKKSDVDNYLGKIFLLDESHIKKELFTYGTVAVKLRIPEDSLLPDQNDCPECMSAKESLAKIGQCSVSGDIVKSYFDSYIFFNSSANIILEKNAQEESSDINDFFTFDEVKKLLEGKLYNLSDFTSNGFYLDENRMQILRLKQDGGLIKNIANPSEELQLAAVKENGDAIFFIDNPTEEVQLEAINQNASVIEHIKNPSENVQIKAVQKSPYVIKYIENPSEVVQMEAIRLSDSPTAIIGFIKNPSKKVKDIYERLIDLGNNPEKIKDIEKPSEIEKLKVVQTQESLIKYINNPSEKLQMIAINKDPNLIQFINNPSEKVQLQAVRINGKAISYIENPSEKVQMQAVKDNIKCLSMIENPTNKVQLFAISNIPDMIMYIDSPTEDAQILAVKKSSNLIMFIKNPTEQAQLIAVKKNPDLISFIKDPVESAQLESIKFDPYMIKNIENPTEKVQLLSVMKDPNIIKYIKNPTDKIKKFIEMKKTSKNKNKRLIKKAEDEQIITLYHGTSDVFYKDIKENGLQGRGSHGNDVTNKVNKRGWSAANQDGVYLSDEEDFAEMYAERAVKVYGGKKMIVTVEVSSNNLKPDDDYYNLDFEEQDGGFLVSGLGFIDEEEYHETPRYELSLMLLHSCVYDGQIPPSQIIEIDSYIVEENELKKLKDEAWQLLFDNGWEDKTNSGGWTKEGNDNFISFDDDSIAVYFSGTEYEDGPNKIFKYEDVKNVLDFIEEKSKK